MIKNIPPINRNKITINWEGSLFVHHSLGMVNREILCELSENPDLDIRIILFEQNQFVPGEHSKFNRLLSLPSPPHEKPDIHIRHHWPPNFTRPNAKKFILIQPWEYGSLPIKWQSAMNSIADEVWVYTRYLKTCYERSGVNSDKIKVVPLGVDPETFNPSATPIQWVQEKINSRFCFLYNGGVTTRKGTDILINAYLSEFSVDEPVCLFIKDSDVYGKDLSRKVKNLSERSDIATIIYHAESIPPEDLPGLYTASHCYVHPYRAEGYGLPIAEAMACGKPVIVTGGGACLDFVEPDSGYFIKCTLETMKTRQVSNMETVGFPFWLTPDIDHLRSVLRHVYSNREQAAVIGDTAGNAIRTLHTWKNTAAVATRHIRAIIGDTQTTHSHSDSDKKTLTEKAVHLLHSGNAKEAAPLFQKLLLRFGENSLAYEGLAIAAFLKKDYNEACNLFSAANRISPDSADILINWYEAAKVIGATGELVQPIINAIHHNNKSDELRALAIEIGVL